jgi:hypothetical protein
MIQDMINGRVFRILSLVLLSAAGSAQAQRIDTPYRFFEETQAAGLTLAYISTDRGSVGLGPESGIAFGGRYHIRLSGPFFVEGEALYFPTTRAVLDSVVVDSAFVQRGEADIALALVQASLRFQVTGQRTWHGLLPFILLGGGVALQVKDDDAADAAVPAEARFDFGTTFAGQLGAGIEVFPVERLAIRLDVRNVLWQLETPQSLLEADVGRLLPAEEWTNNLTASIGLSFHF